MTQGNAAIKPQLAVMPDITTEYFNNSKVANVIINDEDYLKGPVSVLVMHKPQTFTTVSLLVRSEVSLSADQVTPYDLTVMDAIYTLTCHGATAFTPEMIIRSLAGDPSLDLRKESAKVDKIIASLDKLATIRIRIDCTEEMRRRKQISSSQKLLLEGYLLPINKLTLRAGNGTVCVGYALVEIPVLYQYAQSINQISSVPIKLFGTKSVSNTDEACLIKRYLLKRIEGMKNAHNHIKSTRIAYEWTSGEADKGMLATLGYKKEHYANWRKKRAKIHHIVVEILSDLVNQDYISGFEETRSRNKITGVNILLGSTN